MRRAYTNSWECMISSALVQLCILRIDMCLQVSWEDFKTFAVLRQSVHRLAVALEFFFSTEGRICKEDFERAVIKILGHPLPGVLVSFPDIAENNDPLKSMSMWLCRFHDSQELLSGDSQYL